MLAIRLYVYSGYLRGASIRKSAKQMLSKLVFLFLFFVGGAWAGDLACGDSQLNTRYVGAMIDAMAQIEAGQSQSVIEALDRSGVARMALFARLHRKRNGEADVLSLNGRFPERFFMGTPKPFDQRDDLSDQFVQQTISYAQDSQYRFVGEILFAHGDKAHGEQTVTGERYVAPDGSNVIRLISALEQRRIPIMTHWEVYDWKRDWPAFDALYKRFPGVTFIWPHAGFASHEQVATVLATHHNVMVTLSKKEKPQNSLSSDEKSEVLGGAVVDPCDKLYPVWRDLFTKYSDRFMFATDAHKDFRWAKYKDIVEQWRMILGQLPDSIAQSLAWRNAERTYTAATPTR